jgi:hypothetical protein
MPLIHMVILALSIGFNWFKNRLPILAFTITSILLISMAKTTISQSIDHMKPSSISQMKSWLKEKESIGSAIHCQKLLEIYFSKHVGFEKAVFIGFHDDQHLKTLHQECKTIYSTVRLDEKWFGTSEEEILFKHNPFVNRLWSNRKIFVYKP